MVHVEQRRLGALEEDRVSVRHLALQDERRIGDARPQPLAEAGEIGREAVPVQVGRASGAAADELVVPAGLREPLRQVGRPEQVARAHAPPAGLVFVGGPDAAQRGADLPVAPHLLGHGFERAMVRLDEVGPVGDDEVVPDRHAPRAQLRDLLLEGPRVDDHPVAHHAEDAGVKDPGRDQMEDEPLLPDEDRVAGVVAAVVTGHHLHLVREEVDDLPLPLVAPLGADDDDVGHERIFAANRTGHSNRPLRQPQARAVL